MDGPPVYQHRLFEHSIDPALISLDNTFKGSVQYKLRWVKNGDIWRVWAWYRGAGYYFVVLGGLRLVFTLFPFPVSTAQIIGESWKNRG
jgi:hypothetical protein